MMNAVHASLRGGLTGALAALALATLALPAAAAAPATEGAATAADFTPAVRVVARVVACTDDSAPLPSAASEALVRAHCKGVKAAMARYETRWLDKAAPFLREIVPSGLPKTVVYPFGGADLTNALAVFPGADEITTISLEHAGDPRILGELDRGTLRRSLSQHAEFLKKLFAVNHNRTIDLGALDGSGLPGPLVFALVGLGVHHRELVSARYFDLAADGTIRYLSDADVAAADQAIADKRGRGAIVARNTRFGNVELVFTRAPGDPGPNQIFRHIRADLSDKALADTPGLLAYLDRRAAGHKVTAMTKAASYLLWRDAFSTIRGWLLGHMAWMISDSTGPTPFHAEAAGFEQVCYGSFRGLMFSGTSAGEKALRELCASQPKRAIPVFFGYPDKFQQRHLIITRPKGWRDPAPPGPATPPAQEDRKP